MDPEADLGKGSRTETTVASLAAAAAPPLPPEVDTVELVLADNGGRLRGKRVPALRWPQAAEAGVCVSSIVFFWQACCELRPEHGSPGMEADGRDVRLAPMAATLRQLPWEPNVARVLCRAVDAVSGQPFAVDPRQALLRVVEDATSLGFEPKVGIDIEFYLLDPETKRPAPSDVQPYSVGRAPAYGRTMTAMRNQLASLGLDVEASNAEYSPGQFEISIRFADAVQTADDLVGFRTAVREIAADRGLHATFMAKPFGDAAGSGAHVHHSLWRNGSNCFAGEDGLSALGRWYLGGLRRQMPALSLFGSPTQNGIMRRRPHSFGPTGASWGGDNRTVGLRVVEHGSRGPRIEQRDGSADCNPYLLIASQLAAGLAGVTSEAHPGPRTDDDGYAATDAIPLPRSVPEAIDALLASDLVATAFAPELVDAYVAFCRYEYELTAPAVSELERERYLEAY